MYYNFFSIFINIYLEIYTFYRNQTNQKKIFLTNLHQCPCHNKLVLQVEDQSNIIHLKLKHQIVLWLIYKMIQDCFVLLKVTVVVKSSVEYHYFQSRITRFNLPISINRYWKCKFQKLKIFYKNIYFIKSEKNYSPLKAMIQ